METHRNISLSAEENAMKVGHLQSITSRDTPGVPSSLLLDSPGPFSLFLTSVPLRVTPFFALLFRGSAKYLGLVWFFH